MNYYYYSRISSVGQSAQRQIENFKNHGHVANNVYIDKIQGNVPFMERPEASKLFDEVTSSEKPVTIVIDSIDRLGRNLADVLKTIELFNENKVNVESIKEGFNTLLVDGRVNPTAKLIIGVMGSIAEMERTRIKERTREGIAIAKASGKYSGRKVGTTQSDEKTLTKHSVVAMKLKKGLSIKDVASITGNSTTTVNKVRKILVSRDEM